MSRTAKAVEYVIEARKGGLLRGVFTHIVNFLSNTTVIPVSIIERLAAGAVGRVLHPNDGVELGEAWASMVGMRHVMHEALQAAGRSFRTGRQDFGEAQMDAPPLPRTSAEALGVNTPPTWRAQGPTGDLARVARRASIRCRLQAARGRSLRAGVGPLEH
jgi:hypothetical protein